MEHEITPEPTAEEHDALIAALERLLAPPVHPVAASGWWRAGLRENTEVSK